MRDIQKTTAHHWSRNRLAPAPGSWRSPGKVSANARGVRWSAALRAPDDAGPHVQRAWRSPRSVSYNAVDRRLMDTFPATDAVAR
jgi:hypothetical protein